jgi:hypothetical protein
MIESAACNRVGSALDWQLKAEVSSIVTQKANRSNSFETQDS